ncbi:MAG: response regulator [Candidatus Saccharibacteria bacterium]|nr:response regulator [Candidatus Saccharibacteria bacterium]
MAKIKILLVEDDKSLREIYGVRLLAEGYDIVSAGDGEEALAMAIKERPALIVSDVMMPKISGFDMLDILRSTTETKDVKVIMMTALSSEDQRQRGEALGADRYLVKSQVGIEDVVRTVHEVLGDIPGMTPTPAAQMSSPVSPQPTPPAAPTPQPAPTAPQPPQAIRPDVAALSPQPAAQPLPQPGSMPAPANPLTTPAPQSANSLPQPTAPFSSPAPRPNNLGNRVIQPLAPPEDTAQQDVAKQMEAELSNAMQQMAAPQQPAPIPQPAVPSPQPAMSDPQPMPHMPTAPAEHAVEQPTPTPPPAPATPQPMPQAPAPTPQPVAPTPQMPQPTAPVPQPVMPTPQPAPQPTAPLPPTPQA